MTLPRAELVAEMRDLERKLDAAGLHHEDLTPGTPLPALYRKRRVWLARLAQERAASYQRGKRRRVAA